MKSNPSYATGTAAKVLLHPGRRAFLLSLLIFIYFFAVYTLFYAGNDAQSMNNRRDPGPLVSDPAGDAWGSGENEEVPKVKPNKFNPRPQPKKPLDIPVNDNKNTETTKDFDDEEDDGGNFIDKIIEEAKNQANDRVMAEIQNQQDQLRDKDPDDALRRDVFRIKGKSSADPEGIAMIKRMMKHSWDSYVKYAWGYDELRPVSKTGRNWYGRHTIGATVIDALDTLWIMGMKEDFNKARDLVLEMSFDLPIDVSFFETTIRVLGGLLAAYDLSSEYRFVLKAREVADRLMPAFNTPTGIPLGMVNLKTGSSRLHSWASGSILAEYGSVQLEFPYLSDVTGESKYRTVSMAVIDKITSLEKPYGGLYPTEISPYDATWRIKDYTVGALADSFYEYLLKCWIASDKDAIKFRKLYDESAEVCLFM
jgi:mannosyl-oligosaccharide alpha-1,2-mannosidase